MFAEDLLGSSRSGAEVTWGHENITNDLSAVKSNFKQISIVSMLTNLQQIFFHNLEKRIR